MTTAIGIPILLGILLLPIYTVVAGFLLGEPRDFRTAGIGLGVMLAMAIFMIASTAMMGVVFGRITPF
ncbi:hypothetical protein ACLI4R_06345 [Natrialbaceae archaeon A-chndr2]|uniref:hypothetical protein n=1 Tax=Natronosalvus amylolyticus TaxID=2961994 RepID=UPI0020C9540C|nr:hypothetical protein [Natronosalvus amylolyticus]